MSLTSEAGGLRARLAHAFEPCRKPGTAELCQLLEEMLGGDVSPEQSIDLERLKQEVYRLRIGGEGGHSLVLKLLKPAVAQTDRLVAERWLPAVGLGDRCPRLLGAAEGLRDALGTPLPPVDRVDRDRSLAAARAVLGEAAFAAASAEGRAMEPEQAVRIALEGAP